MSVDPRHRSVGTECNRVQRSCCAVLISALVLVTLMTFSGCAGQRYVVDRKVRANPLQRTLKLLRVRGPKISQRTVGTLRKYGLSGKYRKSLKECFTKMRETVRQNPDSELIYALSELAYVEAKKAQRQGNDTMALNYYGIALTNSYDYLFSEDLQRTRNQYDPQFRAACDLYNQSLEDTLRLMVKDNRLQPGQVYRVKTEDREFLVRTEMRGQWHTDEFENYEFVSDYEIGVLRSRHTTYGLGVPLVAVRRPKNSTTDQREEYYPKGLSYGVTALMRCAKPEGGRTGDATTCVLEFFDPLTANQIQLADHWVPLETDLTTPLAYFLDSPEFRARNQATEGLINPASSTKKRGLYMLEPYDPKRIPVLMVHGLWSSPVTWMDMFNDLRSFPEIRKRYQFWFYLYPSGQPFWISATQLREDLKQLRSTVDPQQKHKPLDQMVLVGHSMGGLISRMQTIDSRDDFWRIVSNEPYKDAGQATQELNGPTDAKTQLVSNLFFKPNQSIKRVVTIGTPHRGSRFANEYTRWLARKIIKLPQMSVSIGNTIVQQNPNVFKRSQLLTVANGIDSLASDSPIFPVMLEAKYAPDVKFHNIIGVLEDPSLLQSQSGPGDGVVNYNSAKMQDVESEHVIDAEHTTIHMTGQAMFEVRRILLEHMREIDSRDRVAALPETEKEYSASESEQTTELQELILR